MADADSITTDSNVISRRFGLPRISIPKDYAETDDSITFKIKTHNGTIEVSSCGRCKWKCRGTVSALEAGGFLRADWCPGLPGNNKTRQTVLFAADGPQLVYGNRCGKIMASPFIVINRASTNKFIVEVRASEDQTELLSQVFDKYWQRRQENLQRAREIEKHAERRNSKEEEYRRYYHSPSLFKDDSVEILKRIFNFSMERLSGKYEFSEYGETTIWVDEQSMQEVLCAGARLFEAVRAAKVVCRRKELRLSIVK